MRLGIDLGGTKIAAIVLAEDQRTVWESRAATPRGDYAATIDAIAGLVHGLDFSCRSREAARLRDRASTKGCECCGAEEFASGRVSALRFEQYGRDFAVRLDAVQGAVALQGVRGAV